jgi:hypothetical protein
MRYGLRLRGLGGRRGGCRPRGSYSLLLGIFIGVAIRFMGGLRCSVLLGRRGVSGWDDVILILCAIWVCYKECVMLV